MRTEFWFYILLGLFIATLVEAVSTAKKKGRNPWNAFFITLLFWPLGYFILRE
ncbi:MAG: hypothetical protein AAF824_17805 [Bacteroidota bacterium]